MTRRGKEITETGSGYSIYRGLRRPDEPVEVLSRVHWSEGPDSESSEVGRQRAREFLEAKGISLDERNRMGFEFVAFVAQDPDFPANFEIIQKRFHGQTVDFLGIKDTSGRQTGWAVFVEKGK